MDLKKNLVTDKQKADFIYDYSGLCSMQDAFDDFVPVFGLDEWTRIIASPEFEARKGTCASAVVG